MSEVVTLDSYERDLVIHLDDADVSERAQEAADKQSERDRIEEERQALAKEMSGQVKALDAQIRERLRQVRLRQDVAPVGVEKRLNPAERSVSEVRLDTGEVINIRAAREDEMQLHMLPYKPDKRASGDDTD